MEQITNTLYWLSTGLLIPVTIFLLFFFIKSLLTIGVLYGNYLTRSKSNMVLKFKIDTQNASELINDLPKAKKTTELLLHSLEKVKMHRNNNPMLDKIIGDYEIGADKEIGKSKSLTKLGPMLGLMGTLIPMGPALVGLATGDISSMANNMQVAFATTVIGIIIGAIGFVSLQLKQRWAATDLNTLEYVVESLKLENQNLSS